MGLTHSLISLGLLELYYTYTIRLAYTPTYMQSAFFLSSTLATREHGV